MIGVLLEEVFFWIVAVAAYKIGYIDGHQARSREKP